MGGVIGLGYEAKINSSFVHINGVLKRWSWIHLDDGDHPPNSSSIVENNFGGFIGESMNSSIRNSYASSKNFEEESIDGHSGVGGFVGRSEQSEFFYNFSFLNTYGKTKKNGSCAGDPSATSKVECEFGCEEEGVSSNLFGTGINRAAHKCNLQNDDDKGLQDIDQNANGLAHSIIVKQEKR